MPAGVLVVACAGRAGAPTSSGGDRGPVGVSEKAASSRGVRDAGGPASSDAAGAVPSNYRASFTKVNRTRFVSQGHAAGRWEVDVWANDTAQKALATRARAVPPGAVVVQEHYERAGDKPTGPVMVMEKMPPGFAKEHGDWRWVIVGSQGQLVRDGALSACAGCHDDAPMDGLFPIVE